MILYSVAGSNLKVNLNQLTVRKEFGKHLIRSKRGKDYYREKQLIYLLSMKTEIDSVYY